ncbi:MAG: hypothetical protein DWQ07_02920 [Chloroflexi bacterium]|nr:MAG: hypothetical protein DWQ07_02920 [Chloroflexota bacterium]MBL1193547.1 hypothetical protein [Chloroflexota bacterium]NOH10838.1 hypothetical protein [Chloroflexota bacterium]
MLLGLGSCNLTPNEAFATQTAQSPGFSTSIQESTSLPEAEITFEVNIPANTPAGTVVQFSVVDEVTGLPFNPSHQALTQITPLRYTATLRVPVGSVVKYRYSRVGDERVYEKAADGRDVRYRMYYVDGPATVSDVVSRWEDTPAIVATGRIVGEALNINNGVPIPNLMVVAGGIRTFTASDGSFVLDGLSEGKHFIIGYALDGSYRTFKQEAIVKSASATPASLQLTPTDFVDVTFNVRAPENTTVGVPIRFAGNFLQFGNTFADLDGGVSTLAKRMPILQQLDDNNYTITLSLPAGADLRYKYTLGDGMWNAEHTGLGDFRLRQIIVPESGEGLGVLDVISTWQSDSAEPIWFDFHFPAYTPATDEIYIQFELDEWMEPLPMWHAEDNRWGLRLYSPIDVPDGLNYRFCRDAQCGTLGEIATAEFNQYRYLDADILKEPYLTDILDDWHWLSPEFGTTTIEATNIEVRGSSFIAGVAFDPDYRPSWDSYTPSTFEHIASSGGNWVTLTPTWTFVDHNAPNLALEPGQDILWPNSVSMIDTAKANGLNVAIYPGANFPDTPEDWWLKAQLTESWWNTWFERVRTFYIHHANMAQRNGAGMLILGGEWLTPALPGGKLNNGGNTNLPADFADQKWSALIADLHIHFDGSIAWVLPYPDGVRLQPSFLKQTDLIVIQLNHPLGNSADAPQSEIESRLSNLLNDDILPIQQRFELPIVVMAGYPSANGGIAGCAAAPEGNCLSLAELAPGSPAATALTPDLQEQVDVYAAFFNVINGKSWISGFMSQGYYPPVELEGVSISVHGKPAEDVMWFWFQRLRGL